MAQTLLPAWQEFMNTAPEELSSNALFWTVPPSPNFPVETHGNRVIVFAAVYIGAVEDGERITKPLRELATPLIDLSGPIPWTAVQSAFDPFFPKKIQLYYFKSRYLSNLNKETIDTIVPLASNPPSPMVMIAIWHYGGAMSRKGPDETAFTGRDAPFLLSIDAVWNDPEETQHVVAYSRNFLKEMEPYSTGGMYVNFAGPGEEGEALVRSAYGANYEKLVALKNTYDPTNLFRLNQNIKPTVQ